MQTYQTAVNRGTQRTDDARSNLTEVRESEMSFSDDVGRHEDLIHEVQDEDEKKRLESDIYRAKASLATFKTMEQDRIVALQQAEAQLQKAEEGFDSVQSQLEQLLTGSH